MNSSGNAYQDMLESIFGKPTRSWDLNALFRNVDDISKTVKTVHDFIQTSTGRKVPSGLTPKVQTLPYNLFEEDTELVYEIAVAGYTKENIKVQLLSGGQLIVKGQKDETNSPSDITEGYRYRGLSKRNFTVRFEIPEGSAILSAKVKHGILTIRLLKPEIAEFQVD